MPASWRAAELRADRLVDTDRPNKAAPAQSWQGYHRLLQFSAAGDDALARGPGIENNRAIIFAQTLRTFTAPSLGIRRRQPHNPLQDQIGPISTHAPHQGGANGQLLPAGGGTS